MVERLRVFRHVGFFCSWWPKTFAANREGTQINESPLMPGERFGCRGAQLRPAMHREEHPVLGPVKDNSPAQIQTQQDRLRPIEPKALRNDEQRLDVSSRKTSGLAGKTQGDSTQMEDDALKDHSKTTSIPTDMAELGSDNADQELTLVCSEATKTPSIRLKQQSNGSKTAAMAGARSAVNKSPRPAWTPSLMPQSACDVPRNGKKATKPSRNTVNVALPRTTAQITRGANHEQEHETQRIL